MKLAVVVSWLVIGSASSALGFEATITKLSPGVAVPVGTVGRNALAPLPGVPVAPERAPAHYEPEGGGRAVGQRQTSAIPVPLPRPPQALGCPIVLND
jgi:hypothetical protein